ncbi:MAG TPA: IclR family transcriptional regulator [Solirubrobacteraceae bacterium]|nr:IclR family transcriptional regulator [Solirubrobacteraceae bacterium]
MHATSPSTLQTADRALLILQQFRRPGDAFAVADLSRDLTLNRSTASRLVTTLVARGFLARGSNDTVHLGPELVRLGAVAAAGGGLLTPAGPVLAALAEQTGEAATLALASAEGVVTVAEAAGRYFVALRSWLGAQTPAHCTADGKVLIAFGAIPVPRGELETRTAATIVDADALDAELGSIRERGWAVSRGELEPGLHGIAAPVLVGGVCVAAICVSGPEYRVAAHPLDELAAVVQAAAERLAAAVAAPSEQAA